MYNALPQQCLHLGDVQTRHAGQAVQALQAGQARHAGQTVQEMATSQFKCFDVRAYPLVFGYSLVAPGLERGVYVIEKNTVWCPTRAISEINASLAMINVFWTESSSCPGTRTRGNAYTNVVLVNIPSGAAICSQAIIAVPNPSDTPLDCVKECKSHSHAASLTHTPDSHASFDSQQ